ncbi:MAG: ABC transporter ATP-binding protein [Acidimicrobiales bacterium]|jgi:ABC-2 type transport system ATP-binding protein/ribosome-dependent ATPase
MTFLAEAAGISKCFGGVVAVDSVDLVIDEREVVGLIGANGAGKTTFIRLLLGLLRPSAGTVRLFGAPPSTATRRRVGYVPQSLGMYADLTVGENWRFASAAFGGRCGPMPDGVAVREASLVGSLPLGDKRLVAFAIALAHSPELLILDEPTSGVGPLGRARLWEEIRETTDRGVGVLVTTHNLEEAEQCDRLVIMADGRAVLSGTAAEIVGDHKVIEVRCRNWSKALAVLERSGFAVQLHAEVLRVVGPVSAVAGSLSEGNLDARVEVVTANLEETFVALVGNR